MAYWHKYFFIIGGLLLCLMGCDALSTYEPTPVAIVITNSPTPTVLPTQTFTPSPTFTPTVSPTPDIPPTLTPFPCEDEFGQILDFNDNLSEIANENLRYRVYVPPCYFSSQKRFPLVILLHGLSFREQQWDELGVDEVLDAGLLDGTLPPMLVAMPYMGTIGQLNQFPPDDSYESVILEELLPELQRNFCVWEDGDYRAIGGISRGGFWAYSIVMRHPDLFKTVGGHSAFFPTSTTVIPAPFNPMELARNAPELPDAGIRMYLDNGASDSAGPNLQLFSSRLTGRGLEHTYIVHPVGDHSNDYWSAHVDEYMAFYGRNWIKNYSDLPGCDAPSP